MVMLQSMVMTIQVMVLRFSRLAKHTLIDQLLSLAMWAFMLSPSPLVIMFFRKLRMWLTLHVEAIRSLWGSLVLEVHLAGSLYKTPPFHIGSTVVSQASV